MIHISTLVSYPTMKRQLVYRWEGHPARELGPSRKQSNDDHRRELLMRLSVMFIALGAKAPSLDERLLVSAALHHDDGEDILGRDVLFTQKKSEHDLAEYCAFRDAVKDLVLPEYWEYLHRAFLLQFARKHRGSAMFGNEALSVMEELCNDHWDEILLFEFLERFDYLLYAVEQYREYNNPHFVREVFPNQMAKIESLLAEAPWLSSYYGSTGIHSICQKVLGMYGSLQTESA